MTIVTLRSWPTEDAPEPKKKARGPSPTERSMKLLRKQGFHVDKAEQWFSFPERINNVPTGKTIRKKRDLFGFCDICAVSGKLRGTLYVQTTTVSHQSARVNKIFESAVVPTLLKAGNTIHVHGWIQRTRAGKKYWDVTVQEIYLDDFELKVRRIDQYSADETGKYELVPQQLSI